MPLVGVDPGDHEHGEPLRHRPAYEALLLVEVEHVKLIDPGRDDQKRSFEHRIRGGRVLDQLHQRIANDHLAGRGSHVYAELEFRAVALADFQVAFTGRDVLRKHFHAAHEVFALFLERLLQQLGVGCEIIRRREGT